MYRILGGMALVSAVAIFTGGFVSARLYYISGGTPFDVVALRYGPAALVTLPIIIFGFDRISRQPGWMRAAGVALLGGAPFGLCVLTGVAGAPVSHGAGIVPAVALIHGSILSRIALQEPISTVRMIGLVVAVVGLVVLVIPELQTGEATWWGELAYLGAGLLWGSFTVALRAWQIKPLEGAAFAAIFSLPYLPIYATVLAPQLPEVAAHQSIIHGIYQGIIFSILAVMLYGWGIKRLGAVAAVATMPLMPVFGALMEWTILGRSPHYFVAIAISLITLGVAMTVWANRPATAHAATPLVSNLNQLVSSGRDLAWADVNAPAITNNDVCLGQMRNFRLWICGAVLSHLGFAMT